MQERSALEAVTSAIPVKSVIILVRGSTEQRHLLVLPVLSAHIQTRNITRQGSLIQTLPAAAIWQHHEAIPGNIDPQREGRTVLSVMGGLNEGH